MSDFLFAYPSFLSGIARSLDLAGQFDEYNDSPSGEIADWLALLADWRVVGQSLGSAMNEVPEQTEQTEKNVEAGRAAESTSTA